MATGPPVQDFRLLLPGYREDCPVEIDILIEGYEIFRDFGHAAAGNFGSQQTA
jgi:hypothetical protein